MADGTAEPKAGAADRGGAQTYEAFSNRASGIQSYATVLALLIAGGWTYYVFGDLRQSERSRADVLLANEELLELQKGVGQIALSAAGGPGSQGGTCYLNVVAVVENVGRRAIDLNYGEGPVLRAARFNLKYDPPFSNPQGEYAYSFNPDGDGIGPLPKSCLVPGEKSTAPFLLEVPTGHVYFLEFRVPVRVKMAENCAGQPTRSGKGGDEESGAVPDSGGFWTARMFTDACRTESD